jgi:hypothetical protein
VGAAAGEVVGRRSEEERILDRVWVLDLEFLLWKRV